MSKINTIVVSGGTHGNELTGVRLVSKWQNNPECYNNLCPSAKVDLVLANPEAVRLNRRYVDHDLNRAFSKVCLETSEDSKLYEFRRAKELNALYGSFCGKKNVDPKVDLLLDIHNTGSNMGMCLILSDRDPFAMRASATLAQEFNNVRIYLQPEERSQSPYFGTIARADICIEIGPQHHGTLNALIFEDSEKLVKRCLELVEEWNRGELQKRSPIKVDVYTQYQDIGYPKPQGFFGTTAISAMIHPDLYGMDFCRLEDGDNLFRTFDGKDIQYHGKSPVYPIFISEPAYYEKDIAMSLTTKTEELW
ncbi:MAG: aspartoacylase [Fibrobacteraceae bacterium]|nr:aspartoacylase [Fibrobacteraceae bacterium]